MIAILSLLLILGCAKCVCHEHLPRTEDGSRALFGRCAMYVLLHLGRFNNNLQSTGSDVDGCVWSVAEVCVGIVGACLPTLRPLFNRGHHLRPERSPQEVHHGYSYGAEHSWKDQTKHHHCCQTIKVKERKQKSFCFIHHQYSQTYRIDERRPETPCPDHHHYYQTFEKP